MSRRENTEDLVMERGILEVTPQKCLHDVHSSIRARNLPPNTPVTFKAALSDQKDIPYCSYAFYITDEDGDVDLDKSDSVGGSYMGCFPAGLLTTLEPAPGQFRYHRLAAKDVSIPWKVKISVHMGYENLEEPWSTPIDTIILERHLLRPGVKRIEVNHGKVRGVLFIPVGDGPFPGVIDMFGGVGGCVQHRSAMLASRGIASFALAYFGYKDLPSSYLNLEVEYFQEAVDYLLSVPEVIPEKCGVIGTCLGGLMAIMMAVYCDKVQSIITINAAALSSSTVLTYKGAPVNKVVKVADSYMTFDEQMRIRPLKDSWKDFLYLDNSSILPVKDIDNNKTIIFVAGDDDSMIGHLSAKFMEETMRAAGKTNGRSLVYEGAGHMIEPPFGVLIEHSYQVRYNKDGRDDSYVMYWGGSAKPQCDAQVSLWEVTQTLFKNTIGGGNGSLIDLNESILKSKL